MRKAFDRLGYESSVFRPQVSALGDWEARLRKLPRPDLVWVPCFRQRDVMTARRWCAGKQLPIIFDPLISSYDKQVYERKKFRESDFRAKRLLKNETATFAAADMIVTDTTEHAALYHETLNVHRDRLFPIPVSAEESVFCPSDSRRPVNSPLEVLFYGSYLLLQGTRVIVEAARRYQGPPVQWVLLGKGPLRESTQAAAAGLTNVRFEEWIDYELLPARIQRADIMLGIFGDTAKASRVIPCKAHQSLASGKPLITRTAPAYPAELRASTDAGIVWVPPNDPDALAQAVARLAGNPAVLPAMGEASRRTFMQHFSEEVVQQRLRRALASVQLRESEPVRKNHLRPVPVRQS